MNTTSHSLFGRAAAFVALMTMVLGISTAQAKDVTVASPNGHIQVTLNTDKSLGYTVTADGRKVYDVSNIGITLGKRQLGRQPRVSGVKTESRKETIRPVVPLKQAVINNNYNQATITLKDGLTMVLRVMDNAVAYRLETKQKGTVEVNAETMTLSPAEQLTCHIQQTGGFHTSYEESYQTKTLQQWQADDHTATLPVLLSGQGDRQILLGETDVTDYPRLFFHATADGLAATFPKAPASWEPEGDRGEKVTDASYIAKTQGTRAFPWRWQVITDSRGLIEQTVPVQLARRNSLKDVSWIKPGQVSWEWWNGATPYGPDVDFKAGNNYETYKYFVDFAAHYGLKYILLDEGWAQSTRDPFTPKDGMRLPELIKYAKSKGVDIVLWLPWLTVEQHLDNLFSTYEQWGIPAVKIDFMDHSDQWMVNYYRRVAAEAARHHIMVDFHGSFTPAGLEQEFPNVMSYEGVRGMEQMGGCRPENSVWLPFMRNAVGPMDFTPGAMMNYQPDKYRCDRPNSGAMGTRAFQMALYVVFESGFTMLADNPTLYYKNDDCTRFIASVPTTWDETRCLTAEAGRYVIVAKRKGNKWFLGGINSSDQDRTLTISLDFLNNGAGYQLTAYKDGVNADEQAMDYRIDKKQVKRGDKLTVSMAKNGGWAAVVEP